MMTKTSSCWRFAAAASPLALIMRRQPDTGRGHRIQRSRARKQQQQPSSPRLPASSTAADQTAANPQENTIVITGFRASLRSSTAKKKNAETVVESVNAEDIGKLPDNSIAESIAPPPRRRRAAQQRPRATSSRSAASARTSRRRPSMAASRPRPTTAGRSSSTNIRRKSSPASTSTRRREADHTAGGLVGSIDLRTIRPLDYGKRVVAIGVRGVYVDQKLLPDIQGQGRPRLWHLRRPVRRRPRRRRPFGSLHQRALPDA